MHTVGMNKDWFLLEKQNDKYIQSHFQCTICLILVSIPNILKHKDAYASDRFL